MNITNIESYNKELVKGMMDKLFFVGKIHSKPEIILDYGCGDGTMLKLLKSFYPETKLFGYDNNPDMIRINQGRLMEDGIYISSDWDSIDNQFPLSLKNKETVILFGTVWHEIVHYAKSTAEIRQAWQRANGFNTVVIRDMIPSLTIDRQANIEDVHKTYFHIGDAVKAFENIWGSIHRQKNLIHFLLKYRYVENWDRELRENYFPFYYEDIIHGNVGVDLDFRFTYVNHYTLPFIRRTVRKDFGIDIKDNTHLQLILER